MSKLSVIAAEAAAVSSKPRVTKAELVAALVKASADLVAYEAELYPVPTLAQEVEYAVTGEVLAYISDYRGSDKRVRQVMANSRNGNGITSVDIAMVAKLLSKKISSGQEIMMRRNGVPANGMAMPVYNHEVDDVLRALRQLRARSTK